MDKILLLLVLFVFCGQKVISQKEDYNWIMGNHIRINFNQLPPVVTLDMPLIPAAHGSTSISDNNGNLLFYTNATITYNYNNQIIYTTPRVSLNNQVYVIPHPSKKNNFYFLANVVEYGLVKGLYLYNIDMQANNGQGAVTNVDTTILSGVWAIARQAGSTNYWLICKFPDRIIVYNLDSNGFSNPVTFNIATGTGTVFKISPDMTKIFLNQQDSLSVLDFNCQTGVVSNLHHIRVTNFHQFEFSRDGEYLYTIGQIENNGYYELTIRQYATSASISETEFLNSEKIIYQKILGNEYSFSEMQLAPDNKIYFTMSDYYLWAIENPELPAPLCSVNEKALWLMGNNSSGSLPNYYYYYPTFGYFKSCSSTTFYYSGISATNFLWNFGDGQTSTGQNTTHIYEKSGKYNVSLTITYEGGQEQTVAKEVTINTKPLNLTILHSNSQISPYLDSTSAGCSAYYKISNPNTSSVFEWNIKGGGGTIISGQYTDSINVKWNSVIGNDTLCVVERNIGGCTSDTSKLAVKRFGQPNLVFRNDLPSCIENTEKTLKINISGIAPFAVKYKKNGQIIEQSDIFENVLNIPSIPLSETAVYEFISIKDKFNCETSISDGLIINIIPPLKQLEIIKN